VENKHLEINDPVNDYYGNENTEHTLLFS